MIGANELFQKASDFQFKHEEPEKAYELYQKILKDFPDFDKKSIVHQMIGLLEQDGLDLSVLAPGAIPEEKRQKLAEEQEKELAFSKILISSGFNFEGYNIVKYSGYISGDDAIQIPRGGLFSNGMDGEKLTGALVKIRRRALLELKEAAYNLGCNAVIGVDFDYLTLDPERTLANGHTLLEPYVISVTANGNAVIIEKADQRK